MTPTRFAIGKRRRDALVAGGTGLVGRELLDALLADSSVGAVHVLVRTRNAELAKRNGLTQHVVDYAQPLVDLPPADDAFCCIGTTIKAAGSQAAFRAVDFDAALAFARAARAAGARRLGLVSALGADASSRVFYNRVKGELEQAVKTLGYDCVLLARPSLLIGDRAALGQPARPVERAGSALNAALGWLLPDSVRPIAARTVALGLLRALQQCDRPGVFTLPSHELQVLGR
ncbi:MAG: nucleoside-diphosphate sugar epimerase [Burkholderiaceae bacterium]|nr:nucleoside-diphosphate sugar epimerase [Burkholderiaceae bacterium]